MTKFFKNITQPKLKKAADPRSLEDIGKEYSKLVSDVGQAQYQVYIYQQEVDRLNRQLKEVNLEAKARGELDKTTPKEVVNE